MTTSENPSRESSLFAQPLKALVRTFKKTPEADFEKETNVALSLDETLDLLGPSRRRAVIDQLAKTDQRHIPVADIAESVACAEYRCTPSELTSDQRKRIYVALLQSHLPRLDAADVVAYDSDTNVVTQGPYFAYIWRAQMALRNAVS